MTTLIKRTIDSRNKEHFMIKELGLGKWMLVGIAIVRDLQVGITAMHQSKYIMDMVSRYG